MMSACSSTALGVLRVHQFGDDADAGLLAGLRQDLQPLDAHALERVRARARLERAGPQELHALRHEELGRLEDHRLVLDRARPGDDRERPRADGSLRERDDGVVAFHLAAGELVRLGDADRLLDARQHLEERLIDGAGVAGDADGRARRAGHDVRGQSLRLDDFDDPVDLRVGGVRLHDDEHVCTSAEFGTRNAE